jgi:Helix-turn-helix domain
VSDELRVAVSDDFVEAIARRAAELVRAELDDAPEWLTIDEAAEHVRSTPSALRWRAQNGKLPGAVKDGGRWLVDRRKLDENLGATVPTSNDSKGRAPLERPRPRHGEKGPPHA